VGDSPGPRVPHTLVCIGIAIYPYIVAVVCLKLLLLSETDNNEEGIEKVSHHYSPLNVSERLTVVGSLY
jgi:hypothetical protein